MTGVAPEATLVAVKVLDQTGVGTVFDVLRGMVYSADRGADVLSMSLRTITPTVEPALRNVFGRAVRYVNQRGSSIVTIAGNDFLNLDAFPGDVLPAEIKPVIAVSAVGPEGQAHFDNFAFYSNFGQAVDLAAPGGNATLVPETNTVLFEKRDFVLSCWSTHIHPRNEGSFIFHPGPHAFVFGTSMAAPHVAGAVAVLRQAFPRAKPDEIRRRLLQAADDVGAPGKDPFFGYGRLNVGRAVADAKRK
ncbi:Thermophilic serine proteinase precursor [compost metagenome]